MGACVRAVRPRQGRRHHAGRRRSDLEGTRPLRQAQRQRQPADHLRAVVGQRLQRAGPKLTPLTYEYGLLTMPGYDQWAKWHDPRLVFIDWGRNDYTGISDIREVYWNPNAPSPTNGSRGAYVPLNGGRRYQLQDIPSGEPTLPAGI